MTHRRSVVALALALVAPLAPAPLAASAVTAAATSPTPVARLQTPLLSLRRAPGVLTGAVAQSRLATALDAAMADPSLGAARDNSCLVVTVGPVTVYDRRGSVPLIPASGLKLVTANAVFDKLGAQSHLTTEVRADHAAGAVVGGNLYLVGGGDPLLRTADYVATLRYKELLYTHLEDLARAVRAAGITHVTGSVVGDESRYDSQRYGPTWKPSYAATGEVGPLSALQVNDGYQSLKPRLIPAARPATQAAALFTTLLGAAGVAVDGAASQGTAPAGAPTVASLPSATLADVVAEVLRQSDNNGAELLTKEIARHAGGAPTTVAGVAVVKAQAAADGLPVDQLAMVDGSGLDRSDRASCRLLVDVLARGGPDGDLGRGLPVAGQTGTLQGRMAGTPAAGRVRAKTGSLDGVSSLSGYVLPLATAGAPTGAPLTFSAIFNDAPSRTAVEALEDRIAVILAGYPQAPSDTGLGPLPVVSG